MSWLLRLALVLCVLATTPFATPVRAENPRPHYAIDVTLDYANAHLRSRQTVTVPNTTGETLKSLVFHVVPAGFDAFDLTSIQVDGTSAEARRDGTVLEVELPRAIAPGGTATVVLDYEVRVPRPGSFRLGVGRGVITLGNWYPVLAVWQGSDWDRHQYVPTGDAFVTEVADYEVTVRTAAEVTVAHSGDLVRRDGGTWQIRADRVRDLALAVSDRWERETANVDGTTLVAYFLPEHAGPASEYLATGAPVVRWAVRNLGASPHRTIMLVETSGDDPVGVGQEYPGLIFFSTLATSTGAGRGGYLSTLVAHELIHQWFYSLVGNDQVYEPWVDEALTTYLSYRFFADEFPAIFPGMWQQLEARYRTERSRLGDRPVNASVYDYPNELDYFAVVYRRGSMFLDELRNTLGDAAFRDLLRDYVGRYQFSIARGTDFLDLAQSRSSTDLSPLFRKYFTYAKYDPSRRDFRIPNGWFYKQANGQGGEGNTGYAVTDDDGIRFWTEFQQGGGVATFGYPASRRFAWDGFVVQVFQKAIFQWRPEVGRVYFVNVLDRLSETGHDDWLLSFRQTPRPLDHRADAGLPWESVVERHLTLLDAYPAIRARYFAEPRWLDLFGLPVSAAEYDNVIVVRAQRAVLQQWKVDVPWARAGEVTIANGGDLAKEAGILPAEPLLPEPAP